MSSLPTETTEGSSFLGFRLKIDSEPPITDVVVALDRMLAQLTAKGKMVLVCVDEAVEMARLVQGYPYDQLCSALVSRNAL